MFDPKALGLTRTNPHASGSDVRVHDDWLKGVGTVISRVDVVAPGAEGPTNFGPEYDEPLPSRTEFQYEPKLGGRVEVRYYD